MPGVITSLAVHALLTVSAASSLVQAAQSAATTAASASASAVATAEGLPRQRADTVFSVSRGARLEVGGRMTSDLVITTWDRDAVSVEGLSAVRVSMTGNLVRLDAANGRGGRSGGQSD